MTYQEFRDWAERRSMDGNWSFRTAKLACNLINVMDAVPLWKREKAWDKLKVVLANQHIAEEQGIPTILIGQMVYIVTDDTDDPISEEPITEVGTRGFWLSGCVPATDDMGLFIPWTDVGDTVFFRKADAMKALKIAREVTEDGVG